MIGNVLLKLKVVESKEKNYKNWKSPEQKELFRWNKNCVWRAIIQWKKKKK